MSQKKLNAIGFALVAASGLALFDSLSRGKDFSQVMDRYGLFSVAPGTPGGIASDGTNFLVAQRATDGRIQGMLISSGIPAPSSFPVLLQTIDLGRTGGVPRVAFDGANYLMVWPDVSEPPADIYGQLISRAGMPLGNPIPIETDTGVVEAGGVAFDGTNYLAVWESNGGGSNTVSAVHGRLISPAGTLVGSRIQISPASTVQKFPAVACNRNEFLVIWTEQSATTNSWSLLGRAIGREGTRGQSLSISQVPMQKPWPAAVASDGTNWLAVWSRETGPFQVIVLGVGYTNAWLPMLHGRIMAADGTAPAPEFEIRRGGVGTFKPAAVFNGTNYLVAWEEQHLGRISGPPYRFEGATWIYVGQLDPAGQPVTTEMRTGFSRATNMTGLVLGYIAGQGIMVWNHAHWTFTAGQSAVPCNPGQPVLRNSKLLPTGASQFEIAGKDGLWLGVQSSTNLHDWSLVRYEWPASPGTLPGTYTTPTPPGGSGTHRFFRTIDGKSACVENLRLINRAKVQWALENKRTDTDTPATSDLFGVGGYLPERLVCPMGGMYYYEQVEILSTCSFGATLGHTQ